MITGGVTLGGTWTAVTGVLAGNRVRPLPGSGTIAQGGMFGRRSPGNPCAHQPPGGRPGPAPLGVSSHGQQPASRSAR